MGKKRNPRSTMSYSQKKRAKFDYRREYFKHNPGLFGCVWSCAYCHKPLLGKSNVDVDHIIPLNSPLGINARFNLVASCHKCNLQKSDNFDYRSTIGYASKLLEVIIFTIQKVLIVLFVGIWWLVSQIISVGIRAFKGAPFMIKIVIVVILLFFFLL